MTARYLIAEVCEQTGFSSSALRYYEQRGVLPPPARSPGGYRLYDDRAVARLKFVARAKQLGCSLDEITDLLRAWDGDDCAPVARRLRGLLEAKRRETDEQTAELVAFARDLRHAAATLDGAVPAGACDDECACMAAGRPAAEDPIVCTLDAREARQRLEDWQRILARVTARERVDGGLRLSLPPGSDVAELAQLARAEQECCAFLAFAVTLDSRGVALEVRAPDSAASTVDAICGYEGVSSRTSDRRTARR